ncbi:hypothetical protein JCM24511_08009 [Saitozyma sp. JCM 24511]|nr:hypothetical protein JCM24511_08009 [Saitozyma sp. JCM 24511]
MNDTERLDIYIAADQSIGLLSSLSYSSEESVRGWKTELTAIKSAIVKDRSSDQPDNGLKDTLLRDIITLSEKMCADLRERYPTCGLPELRGSELVTIGYITRSWTSWTREQGHQALALVNLLTLPLDFERRSRGAAKTSTVSAVDSCDNSNDMKV